MGLGYKTQSQYARNASAKACSAVNSAKATTPQVGNAVYQLATTLNYLSNAVEDIGDQVAKIQKKLGV